MKRRPKKRSAAEREAHDRFRRLVLAEPCLFSQTRQEHRCEGQLDPHHVLPKQFLKAHFSTQPDSIKWRLIHAPELGVPLCRSAHDAVTVHATHVWREELPARVCDFASEWGVGWRLEQECPSLGANVAS